MRWRCRWRIRLRRRCSLLVGMGEGLGLVTEPRFFVCGLGGVV